jgi:hypothetical protein
MIVRFMMSGCHISLIMRGYGATQARVMLRNQELFPSSSATTCAIYLVGAAVHALVLLQGEKEMALEQGALKGHGVAGDERAATVREAVPGWAHGRGRQPRERPRLRLRDRVEIDQAERGASNSRKRERERFSRDPLQGQRDAPQRALPPRRDGVQPCRRCRRCRRRCCCRCRRCCRCCRSYCCFC